MRIEAIGLDNWMAFKGWNILDPLPSGAIAVVARYANNPRRSNWAGKTALLEAVEWCLFGLHRKRYEDDLIHFGQDFVRVSLRLTDGTTIERSRKRGKSTKVVVTVGGETFVKKLAQEKIVEILGFDSPDYRATVCFAQGETAAMVERTSGERRKVVAQWLELDAWLRVAARARANAKTAAKDLQALRMEQKIRATALEDFDPEGCARDVEGSQAELTAAKERRKAVELELEAVAELEIQRMDRERLAKVNLERRDLRSKIQSQGIDAGALEGLRDQDTRDRSAENEAREALAEARALAGGSFDGQCPVICAECPVPDHIYEAKEAVAAKVAAAQKIHKAASGTAAGSKAALRVLAGQDRALAKLRETYNARTAEAKRLGEAIEARGPDLVELSDEDVAELKVQKRAAQDAEVAAATDLRSAQEEIARGEAAQKWVDETADQIQELEKKLRAANLAVRATGAGGVPAAIAESSLGALEQRANGILAGTGLSFDFAWDRETKALVTSCYGCGYAYRGTRDKACPACGEDRPLKRADELEILVDDGANDPEDVKAKSGGAKILVGSAIRLSAGMMLRDRRGARCAWAQVDEPFGALDAENREALARSFAGMLGSVGLEQAFVVSHDGTLLDALPGRIEIVRFADHSTVELV